ncbi:hypothetical protein CSUI_003528 [Cystoisospora suis]|uniref:HIT-type domain-containing protein n=1 Tax=Cystoisospora suis TaxID=483139 RepID=A0A2C6L401_9APIC|nr:hypothetical protein CSUI_003528 [Cystoisospora suis]
MNETAGGNPSSSSPPPIHLPSLSSSGCFSSPRNVSTSSNSSSASSSPCPPPFSASSPAPPYVGHNRGRGRGGWRGGGYGGGGRTRGFYSSYRGGGGGRRGGGGGYNGSSSYHYSQDSIRSFHNGPTSPTFKRRQEGEMIIPAAKICAVCGSEDIKYKLPCCRKPFCSSLCFKKHQEESPCKGSRQEGGGEGSRGRETGAPSREREQENRGGEQGDQDRRRESDPSVSSSSASYGSSVCGVDTESERRDGRELGKKDERESEASDVICVGEGVHTPDNKKDSNKQDHDVEVKGKGEGEESPRSEKKKERNSKRRREEEHISVFGSLLHDVEDEGPIGEVEELVVCHEENEVDLPPGKMPSKLASKSLRQGRRRDLDGEEEEDDEEEGEEGELSDSAEEDEHDPHDTRVFQDIEDEEEEEDLSSDGEGEEEEEDDRQPPRSLPASIIPGVDDEGDADHELSIQQKDALRCSSYLREAFEKSRNLRDAFQDIATSRDKTATLACYLNDGWFEGICNRVMDIVMMKEKEEE